MGRGVQPGQSRQRAGRAQLQVATEADSRGGEESAMTLAPGRFWTASLFLGSGQAGIEVVIIRRGRSAAPGLSSASFYWKRDCRKLEKAC